MSDYKQSINDLEIYIESLENQLSHTTQELDGVYTLVDTTPNNMELGKRLREYYFEHTEEVDEEPVYIYESPDEGKTLYRRQVGETIREEKVVDNLEEPPVSRERAQARLDYLKTELAHERYHDGWTIKGMKDEADWLQSQLGGEQLELKFDE